VQKATAQHTQKQEAGLAICMFSLSLYLVRFVLYSQERKLPCRSSSKDSCRDEVGVSFVALGP
jgi:hypothetical protein